MISIYSDVCMARVFVLSLMLVHGFFVGLYGKSIFMRLTSFGTVIALSMLSGFF